jgi:hypothetical protein
VPHAGREKANWQDNYHWSEKGTIIKLTFYTVPTLTVLICTVLHLLYCTLTIFGLNTVYLMSN